MLKKIAAICAVVMTIAAPTVQAGESLAHKDQESYPDKVLDRFAGQIQRELAARNARVAIVARTGRDRSELPDGLNYTHAGFWTYSVITKQDGTTGTGYAIHQLFQKASDRNRSHIGIDYPRDFVSSTKVLDVGVIIPKPALQQRILERIASGGLETLHNPNYSLISNPHNLRYQNCTEYLLDVIMAELYDTENLAQIKANAKAYFTPQKMEIGPLTKTVGATLMPGINTDDQGAEFKTATFGSIARFMKEYDLAQDIIQIRYSGAEKAIAAPYRM